MEVNVAEDILKAGMQMSENLKEVYNDDKLTSTISDDEESHESHLAVSEKQRIYNVFQDSRFSFISLFSTVLTILNWLAFIVETILILVWLGCRYVVDEDVSILFVFFLGVLLLLAHCIVQFFISFSNRVYFNQIEIRELLKERQKWLNEFVTIKRTNLNSKCSQAVIINK